MGEAEEGGIFAAGQVLEVEGDNGILPFRMAAEAGPFDVCIRFEPIHAHLELELSTEAELVDVTDLRLGDAPQTV